jgi:hypothetical protein
MAIKSNDELGFDEVVIALWASVEVTDFFNGLASEKARRAYNY